MQKIGLFPLGMVIFPGSSIPLHIFEPRYKQLVRLVVADNDVFGINLVNADKLHQIGCTVKVTQVVREYEDGRMDIVVTGQKRFFLQSMYEGKEPYYVGHVQYFEDSETVYDNALREECVALHNEIIGIVYPGSSGSAFLIHSTMVNNELAFVIAQKAGLELEQKQKMLEMRSEHQRLEFVRKVMHELLPDLRQKQQLQRVIMADGYLPGIPRPDNDDASL
jgi:ATP-dependent Lon protease